jgi:peptide/nickel transport system substrate-binding protein
MNSRTFTLLNAAASGSPPAGTSSASQGVSPPQMPKKRSMGALIAVIVVIVLIIAGVGIYLSTSKPSKTGAFTLAASASYSIAGQGTPITFYSGVSLPGSSISYTVWNFGNGVVENLTGSSGSTVSYTYPNPGNYLVYVEVVSTSHIAENNALALVPVSVTPSTTSTTLAYQYPAEIQFTATSANTANITSGYPNVVSPGGYINATSLLPASFSSYPVASGWNLNRMTFSAANVSVTFNATQIANGLNYLNLSNRSLMTPGIYPFTLSVVTNNTTATSTWTFVSTAAVGPFAVKHSSSPSTHTGIVDATWIPGGYATLDPAIAYDTVSYEAIYNLYQPLVQYTPGSSASSFIPVVATQVPTASNGLLVSKTTVNNITYVNYTFNVNTTLKFANGQPVTPYDVYFSVLRTLLFANDPGRPGWLLAHALIPGLSIYGPFNTTPFWVDHAITFNSTSVTFHILPTTNQSLFGIAPIDGTNAAYMLTETAMNSSAAAANNLAATEYSSYGSSVYFLQLLTQPVGFVMDAAWANSSGASIGSFDPNVNTVTTNYSSAFYNYQAYGNAANWNTKLQFGSMGSGPYVVQSTLPGQVISFVPNQNYTQTVDYPAPSALQPRITIYYYTSESVAQEAFQTGAADFAEGAFPPSATPLVLKMIKAGQANSITTPELALFTWFFNLQTNVTGLDAISSGVAFPSSSLIYENATGASSTSKATAPLGSWEVSLFFANLSVRRAFTYAFDQAQYIALNTNSSVKFAENLTGFLPSGLLDYPANISNMSTDPWSPYYNMTLAKYYWSQSPYAGAAAGSITFPIFSISGDPVQDTMIQSYWIPAIENATNNAVKPFLQDINFATLLSVTAVASAHNPLPLYFLGWIDDYPDPTDFAAPFVQPYGIYSYPDGLFSGPGFNATTNPHQWKMINEMWNASAAGAGELVPATRAYDYWLADYLSVKLDLLVGDYQPIAVAYYRSWITPSSMTWSASPEASLSFLILFPVTKT